MQLRHEWMLGRAEFVLLGMSQLPLHTQSSLLIPFKLQSHVKKCTARFCWTPAIVHVGCKHDAVSADS
jgi:hypothetical protein